MATPRVLGHELRLTANLCLAREASVFCYVSQQHPLTVKNRERKNHTQQGLVGTAATSNNTDHTTRAGVDDLLGARGKLDAGLALIGVVADDGDVVAGGAAQGATVTNLLLHVRDDGTFGHGAKGKNIADGKSGLLASVDELTGVHALVGDEGLGDLLVLVRVAEDNLGEGSTAACQVPALVQNPLSFLFVRRVGFHQDDLPAS
jgi:hypothetical protein